MQQAVSTRQYKDIIPFTPKRWPSLGQTDEAWQNWWCQHYSCIIQHDALCFYDGGKLLRFSMQIALHNLMFAIMCEVASLCKTTGKPNSQPIYYLNSTRKITKSIRKIQQYPSVSNSESNTAIFHSLFEIFEHPLYARTRACTHTHTHTPYATGHAFHQLRWRRVLVLLQLHIL